MNEDRSASITKQIAVTAILLAICLVIQIFKDLSIFITGPVINLCIILAVMVAGLKWGLVLSLITPVSAFMIAPSPVMNAVPLIIPFIMLGNVVLAIMVHFLFKPAVVGKTPFVNAKSVIFSILSALAKGVVMGATISFWLLPMFISPESKLFAMLPKFRKMFSMAQFITALIGFVYFFIIWIPLRRSNKNE